TGHQTVLYSFTGGVDGAYPQSGVLRDAAGNLYGTTASGGDFGSGVVYKLDTAGHQTVLHSFTGTDGSNPTGAVIRDPSGSLYGTTTYGGAQDQGVVYQITAGGQFSVLHSFASTVDGALPNAGVVRDASGNLYGTTVFGGTLTQGTVYKIDTG